LLADGDAAARKSSAPQGTGRGRDFYTALRAADFEGSSRCSIRTSSSMPTCRAGPTERDSRENWATGAIAFAKNARFIRPALVDGAVGLVLAPRGRLVRGLRITVSRGKISAVEVVADREPPGLLEIAVLDA
jgi:hypothetical protein